MAIAGVILGGLLGEVAARVPALAFLDYGRNIGISPESPMVLDFSVMRFVVGFQLHVTVAAILGFIVSIFLYKKVL